jgi:PAS domain S-box-containing protein
VPENKEEVMNTQIKQVVTEEIKHPFMVLLVDDQPFVAEMLQRQLSSETDINFHYCQDPNQAIGTAERVGPTVILLDLVMPDLDGLTLCKFIRAHPATRDIPVIMLSSNDDPATKAEAFAAGANDYIVKLPESVELIARLRYHSAAYVNKLQRDDAYRALRASQTKLEELNLQLLKLASFPRLNPQPVIELAPSGEITYTNPAADKLFPDLRSLDGQHPLLIGLGDIYATLQQGDQTEIVREVAIGAASYEKHIYYVPESELIRITVLDVTESKRAEQSLRKLSLAVEQSPSAIAITDLDANIEYVNEGFVKVTGYSRAELIGQNPRLLHSGRTPAETYKTMWASLKRGEIWKGEFINRRKDGSEYIELALMSPVRQADGRVTHYLAIKEDITQFKQAQQALHDSRENLHRLLDSMAEGAYGVDINGECTFVNRAFLKMLGYQNENEVLGKYVHQLIHHSHADGSPYPADECPAYRVYRTNQATNVSNEVFWRKDGVAIPVEYWAHPIVSDGVVTGAIVTFVDITERKQAELALRASEERFRTIFAQAPFGIALIDSLAGQIYEVNPRFAMIAGRSVEEMTNIDWKTITHPDDVQADLENVALMNAGKTSGFQMEKRYLHPDGSVVWVSMTVTPLKFDDKAHPRHLCMIQDITKRKLDEANLAEQLNELQRWHDATSGREGRILDLKHEVNEMLAKAGQPPRYPSAEENAE